MRDLRAEDFPHGQGPTFRSSWSFGFDRSPGATQLMSLNEYRASWRRRFVCILYRTSVAHLSLGAHIDLESPNIEVHLPCCFIRIGWVRPIECGGPGNRALGIQQHFVPQDESAVITNIQPPDGF